MKELSDRIKAADHIVFFGGAGVSTESNIPDFRSEHGIYSTVRDYGVSPEQIISHTYFLQHPETFFDFYRKYMIFMEAKPNEAHKALAKLEAMGKLKAIITQNIDGLHQMAGSQTVYELHGSIHRNYCTQCHEFYDVAAMLETQGVPLCTSCGHVIKPDVVLYEEPLETQVLTKSIEAIQQADVLIVGGTSLSVYPAAGLIDYYQGDNLILINNEPTLFDTKASLCIKERIGEVLGAVIKRLEEEMK